MSGAEPDLTPVPFSAIEGWSSADLTPAWRAFRASAEAMAAKLRPLRVGRAATPALLAAAKRAQATPLESRTDDIRQFLEENFQPHRVGPAEAAGGFLTGYYEPVIAGSHRPSADFFGPILPRPEDLVTVTSGESARGLPAGFSAGRRGPGGLAPYPDRAAIEALATVADLRPLLWLRDWTEVFLVQVQGSARVRLTDGTECRLVYAGRNGHPYTSIGRILIDAGKIAPAAMSLDTLKAWLRAHGQEIGDEGRRVMQRNASYVFFRTEPAPSGEGPIGGAGLPLAARSSIAVDRTMWPYGLPFWIDTDTAVPGFDGPLARLFIAQDTGSAIVGSARADLFMGSGDAAGHHAGLVRHAARFTVLLPRDP